MMKKVHEEMNRMSKEVEKEIDSFQGAELRTTVGKERAAVLPKRSFNPHVIEIGDIKEKSGTAIKHTVLGHNINGQVGTILGKKIRQ